VENLGVRVHNNPRLVEPFIERLKVESDPWVRQLTAWSLKTTQGSQVESVRPLINQVAPEVKVVVITPGIDDFNPRSFGRNLDKDYSVNWPLRRILELGGVKVLEQRWTGEMWKIPQVQRFFDQTQLDALNLAGSGGAVLNLTHSAGAFINERLFHHIAPGINTPITEAIKQQRIKIVTLNSFSSADFSKVDRGFRNFCNINDFSWVSTYNKASTGFFPIDIISPLFNNHNVYSLSSSHFHSAHTDPIVMSYVIHQAFPNLSMPRLSEMVSSQNIKTWVYFPVRGNWPGVYNLGSVAAPSYFHQAGNVNVGPPLEHMQHFRAPDNYYLHQNQFQPAPKFEMPKLQMQQVPRANFQEHKLFDGSIHRQQPYYAPQSGSWPGTYNFNIRAPDNYFQSPAATMPVMPLHTPPVIFTPPPMQNVR